MAEGGQHYPIIYHIDNVGTLNVVNEQIASNIDKAPVGSIAISPKIGAEQGEAFIENDGNDRRESGKVHGSDQQDKELEMKGIDITWLQNGRFGLYINKPLLTGTKVYKGVQKLISNRKRDVAIKLLAYKEKNHKEVDFLLKLQHPNIVQIIDAGDYRGAVHHWIYIVMELCSQNLQNYIDENKLKPRDFRKLFSFSKQLVAGLAYLHQNKVVHRDLKPENVLMSMCKDFVKLSDFGLSKEIQQNCSVATVTTIGAGSEGYRSPETYQEGNHISPRLDIFPLGLILHFLFTNGQHPFGSDPYDWRDNIRRNKNLDLSRIPEFEEPNTSKKQQLQELLHRLLRHAPCHRPTADEVLNDTFFKDLKQEEIPVNGNMESNDISLLTSKELRSKEDIANFQPKDSKAKADQFQVEVKKINELIATIDIPSSSMSSPPSKDTKLKQEESSVKVDGKPTSVSQAIDFQKRRAKAIKYKRKVSCTTSNLHDTEIENSSGIEKRNKELEERASNLMGLKEFHKATEVLYELYNCEGSDKFEALVRITECEIYLNRGQEKDSIRRLKDFLLDSRMFSAEELLGMAGKLHENSKYVRSLILLHVSHHIHKTHEDSPDDEAIWIKNLQRRLRDNTKPLLEVIDVSRDIGITYRLEYMERLLNDLRSVKNTSPEVRALSETSCLVDITYICHIVGNFRRLLPFGKDGIEIMEKQFGDDAGYFTNYATILENVAGAYEACDQNWLAEKYYVSALEGYKKAKDLTENDRLENIKRTSNLLNKIRKKIKNSDRF